MPRPYEGETQAPALRFAPFAFAQDKLEAGATGCGRRE